MKSHGTALHSPAPRGDSADADIRVREISLFVTDFFDPAQLPHVARGALFGRLLSTLTLLFFCFRGGRWPSHVDQID